LVAANLFREPNREKMQVDFRGGFFDANNRSLPCGGDAFYGVSRVYRRAHAIAYAQSGLSGGVHRSDCDRYVNAHTNARANTHADAYTTTNANPNAHTYSNAYGKEDYHVF
jgi:hypothetical protein